MVRARVMVRLAVALVLCLSAGLAAAQNALPALFNVSGVASDDVLNVRRGPDAGTEKLSELAHDAEGIEVVRLSEGGGWGQINIGERSGWVAMRFLALRAGQDPETLPVRFACFGTEPFWSLGVSEAGFALREFSQEAILQQTFRGRVAGRSDRFVLAAGTEDVTARMVIRRLACSDGMSDRAYGLDTDLWIEDGEDLRVMTGCCSVAP
ncbi:peptide-binding protein [Pseudaestuariivita sp.]|uniref:peptide-binding protein n=1 Tax=Pseudaestuariivita sp. TaxID=2211669 RepID=UPI0040586A80